METDLTIVFELSKIIADHLANYKWHDMIKVIKTT